MTFEQFDAIVKSYGMTAEQRSHVHWQIFGGLRIINVYPHTKRGMTFYVQGMAGGRRGDVLAAINAAKNPACQHVKRAKRKANYRDIKRKLLRNRPWCNWCRLPLSMETATLDHIIALSRGGSNGEDNCVLACNDCNCDRKNNVTAAELEATR